MPISEMHTCGCANCQQAAEHPDKQLHQQMNLLLSRLDEQQRRWYVALEANRLGHGGVRRLAQNTGLDEKTIQRGQNVTHLLAIRDQTTLKRSWTAALIARRSQNAVSVRHPAISIAAQPIPRR